MNNLTKKEIKTIIKFYKNGISLECISFATKISIEKLKRIIDNAKL